MGSFGGESGEGRARARRLLALDGGGLRGLVALGPLAQLEAELRAALGRPRLVLADWFDFIAGTSTGALIATCLSWGMPVERVRALYLAHGPELFRRAPLWRRLWYRFREEPLAALLQETFGRDTQLGDARLRTLLALVLRSAGTDSPWPLTNHPRALYNAPEREDCGLRLPLWQLVRASCAAPTYFAPQWLRVGRQARLFVDGGVSAYNNPALLLFLLATLPAYRVGWPTGEERLLLVSVGTGGARALDPALSPLRMHLLHHAAQVPQALLRAASVEQDLLCRVLGRCRHGAPLDRELGSLVEPPGAPGPLPERLFTYVRYDADLSPAGLQALGLGALESKRLQRLDAVDQLQALQQVGAAAARQVHREHLSGFLGAHVREQAGERDRGWVA
ncbi:patatin [Aggregicoccus sp. 17bor-14]|uniref:patatin-like phospholipase family protein n=1 Tax=Myxococcaceae TaxID=31 RepID=UPI00129C1BFE|nr:MULTISPECIES: patatin-like phospholipase family protein [Myxococcaceae]MBF5045882.1 patatin-like phospholipase family protein [Simulacricoccus sp. 17bor-14]MRI91616.1 patatin [Aggregicoccus sp. 17bor-14]